MRGKCLEVLKKKQQRKNEKWWKGEGIFFLKKKFNLKLMGKLENIEDEENEQNRLMNNQRRAESVKFYLALM